MIYRELAEEAERYLEVVQGIRRELHQIPEFGLDLPKTRERILASIHGLGEIHLSDKLSSIVLHIKGGQPGPTVLLRADMDALAVEENMHMITGSKPIAAYGIHVTSSWQPPRTFGGKAGALMASASDLIVTFTGRGGHGSSPWMAKDPISAMTDAMAGLQTMINKQFNVFDPVVVNIGWLKAGDDHTTNVIPEKAAFGATIRTFSPGMLDNLKKHVTAYLEGTAAAFGVTVDIDWGQYATEVVMNDPAATERVRKVVREAFGEQAWMEWPHPIAGAEDFGSVVREIPGAFIFLGAAPADSDWQNAAPNHSNRAVFDDSVVPSGCALLAGLAFDVLNEAAAKA